MNVKNTQHSLKRKTLFLVSVLSPLFEYRFIRTIYYILFPEGDEGGGSDLREHVPKKSRVFLDALLHPVGQLNVQLMSRISGIPGDFRLGKLFY